ncbi:MAG: GNAT family N-acetyltransferase [Pseudomonadota bacterium]
MVTVRPGFDACERDQLAALFWQAFEGKLGKVLRPEPKALALLAQTLNPNCALIARTQEGKILGGAGIAVDGQSLIEAKFANLTQHYGLLGTLWRVPLLVLLDRSPQPGCLTMDGLFVAEEARGQGVGTALLSAVQDLAVERGYKTLRLDVIDTNPRARALYERQGFVPQAPQRLGPFAWIFGFSAATPMLKTLHSDANPPPTLTD